MKRHGGNLNVYYYGKGEILLRERSSILYESNHRTFWKKRNYGDSEQISEQISGETRMSGRSLFFEKPIYKNLGESYCSRER